MKKAAAQQIRYIAEQIGDVRTESHEWVSISGQDLLLSGFSKRPNASSIDPQGTYEMKNPVIHIHSSKKAMKRAFRAQGQAGIYAVVEREFVKRFPDEK